MISMQSITLQDLQYSYCAAILVVLMCDEAKEPLAVVLTTIRCHFDEMVTAHRNEVLISFCQRSYFFACFARSSCGRLFLSLGPLIQGMNRLNIHLNVSHHLFKISKKLLLQEMHLIIQIMNLFIKFCYPLRLVSKLVSNNNISKI